MTGHDLRILAAGELSAPRVDADSLEILNEAIEALARRRTPYWLGDSSVRLHALASLLAQAQTLLPDAVHDTRDQDLTWNQIGQLLNTTAATAARRYGNKHMINLTRITGIMPMSACSDRAGSPVGAEPPRRRSQFDFSASSARNRGIRPAPKS